MNAVLAPAPVITHIRRADLPPLGWHLGGGFFINLYRCGETTRALIAAPKAAGEFEGVTWSAKREILTGAMSFTDGLANTDAMAAAGSELATRIRALRIGDVADWCLPALDQLEILYRTCKPTTDDNAYWAGANINAIPPTQRYLPDAPAQTTLPAYREGGAEAFETDDWYWSSTQYAGFPGYAWNTLFDDGHQFSIHKGYSARARPVRSLLVID